MLCTHDHIECPEKRKREKTNTIKRKIIRMLIHYIFQKKALHYYIFIYLRCYFYYYYYYYYYYARNSNVIVIIIIITTVNQLTYKEKKKDSAFQLIDPLHPSRHPPWSSSAYQLHHTTTYVLLLLLPGEIQEMDNKPGRVRITKACEGCRSKRTKVRTCIVLALGCNTCRTGSTFFPFFSPGGGGETHYSILRT